MQKNQQSPETELSIWFDGKNINEALFCEEFLREHRIIFTNRAFFTPDGRVTDDLPLRGEIYESLKSCAVNCCESGQPAAERETGLRRTVCDHLEAAL